MFFTIGSSLQKKKIKRSIYLRYENVSATRFRENHSVFLQAKDGDTLKLMVLPNRDRTFSICGLTRDTSAQNKLRITIQKVKCLA